MKIKVNEKSIFLSSYSAELFEKNLMPYTIENTQYKYGDMLTSKYVKSRSNAYGLYVCFMLTAETHGRILKNIMSLVNDIKKCEITVNDDDFEDENLSYDCVMNSYEYEFITIHEALLKIDFSCEVYGPVKKIDLVNVSQTLFIGGARDTCLSFEIVAKSNVQNLKIDNFLIKSLASGKKLKIDGEKNLVTVDGSLYMRRNELSFSKFIYTHGFYDLYISAADVCISLIYRERW